MNSWPKETGRWSLVMPCGFSGVLMVRGPDVYSCRSVPQMPPQYTSIVTW